MKQKIGRNEPCFCGSGKKYKKCHYLNASRTPIIQQIAPKVEVERIRQVMEKQLLDRRSRLAELGVFIDFVVPILFKGKKVWALGNRVYLNKEKDETFHEFIVDVLKQELGRDWWEGQVKLQQNERHFIFECFIKYYEWKNKNAIEANVYGRLFRAKPDGYSRALTSLAFDVCSLLHAVHLPEAFLKRLRAHEGYQAVRYEIAVAAMFARMGYKIEFLDEVYTGHSQTKHAEFIATNPSTKEEIVVEVKSKERSGVLHKEGNFMLENELKSSVTKLLRHALTQKQPGKPFIIFIDMNLPLSNGIHPNNNPWLKAVTKMRRNAVFASKGKSSPTNAIVFTNYSYHYGSDQETGSGEWFLEKSLNPEVQILSPDFEDKFISVLDKYGNVPNIDMTIET